MDGYEGFQAPEARLEDTQVEALDLATRGSRLGASLLDGLIFGIGVGLLAVFMIPLLPRSIAWIVLAAAALTLVAWNLILLHRHGQSLGKRLVGVRIVRRDGSRASLGRIVGLRIIPVAILRYVPIIGPILGLTDALLIFRDSRRCLHDDIADTAVVKA